MGMEATGFSVLCEYPQWRTLVICDCSRMVRRMTQSDRQSEECRLGGVCTAYTVIIVNCKMRDLRRQDLTEGEVDGHNTDNTN